MPDGSHLSLQEVFNTSDGQEVFAYTSVAAMIDGNAFAGKINARIDDADDEALLSCLLPVPPSTIFPLYSAELSIASQQATKSQYCKTPSFAYEDTLPGRTFVADCLLSEAHTYELLKANPHPNIAVYHGCNVGEGRVTKLVLDKYKLNLVQYADTTAMSATIADALFEEILSAVRHLHMLGFAHNDLNPYNICIDAEGHAVVIDLDACLPFDEPLVKGVGIDETEPISCVENDWQAMDELDHFLQDAVAKLPG